MSQFRIAENITAAVTIDGVPFVTIVLLTICVYNTRSYEVFDSYRSFADFMDPYPWKSGTTVPANLPSDDIDTILMATDLLLKSYI